ncbi:MAG: DUF3244 domain-containing protein [Tannerella sp.]|jgi:hypothetical protein|nr:DUF3244 domain-containing protein [Tannerella sp.]
MKKIGLLLLLTGCFWTTAMPLGNTSPFDEDEIDLSGNLTPEKTRSLTVPIEAYLAGSGIEVYFLADLGTITVSIHDETETAVYQQSYPKTGGLQTVIPVSGLASGTYTIEFMDSQGRYLSGSFEIE